ncbi:unnamed protein product [Coffea canephora]|uniref:Uncharacterized protein n=1 Tax=Coffea canephora TaxID=49390 RepID=A0A068U1F0_COFCA|nr:unnamed protein product [Coffea canephora]
MTFPSILLQTTQIFEVSDLALDFGTSFCKFCSQLPKEVILIATGVERVMGHEKRPTTRQVVKTLISEDGWTGFYRGLGPRFFSMSAWGTSMILAYEYLKRLCAKEE